MPDDKKKQTNKTQQTQCSAELRRAAVHICPYGCATFNLPLLCVPSCEMGHY